MATGDKVATDLFEVVYLAVLDGADLAILVRHGLTATFQVDYRKPTSTEDRRWIPRGPSVVGSTMR
jgi:hypothetical protein